MSNALAIASVTAVLTDLINQAMVDNDVTAAIGGNVSVTAVSPSEIEANLQKKTQLNLFLYHLTSNAGWSNMGLPSRDSQGTRLTNPPLALDLYYLLTAYGRQDLEAEIILGFAIQKLHETPVLTRRLIRDTLNVPAGPGTPPSLGALIRSDLAEQVEQVKITPHPTGTEESSKLWSAFQAGYRPSFAYHVSVILIESDKPTRSPLPVLARGTRDPVTGRDQGVTVQASMLPPFPTLEEVAPPNKQLAVRMGEALILRGHHLDADQVAGRLMHLRSSRTIELVGTGATPTEFQVSIPSDPPPAPVPVDSPENPDNWQAGTYVAAGVVRRAGKPDRVTNGLPFALAPRIVGPVQSVVEPDGKVTLTVSCSPKVWKGQKAFLIVGDLELAAEEITTEKTPSLVFVSDTVHLPEGSQMWVRLRVDGIESILIDRSGAAPAFDPSQQVTI